MSRDQDDGTAAGAKRPGAVPRLRESSLAVWRRASGRAAMPVVLLLLLLALALAALPPAPFRAMIERRLSAASGRSVSIGAIERHPLLSFTPTITVRRLVVAQPAWIARGSPPMAQVSTLRLRLPVLPLLVGKVRPRDIEIGGGRLVLLRATDGRANWKSNTRARQGSSQGSGIGELRVRDLDVTLVDRQRNRAAVVRATATPGAGIEVNGRGRFGREPVRIAGRIEPDGRFSAQVRGTTLDVALAGRTARPFDFSRFDARTRASGRDLHDLDAIVEAGLPGTQPFRLAARIGHDRSTWTISGLAGTIGRSRLSGDLHVDRLDGRSVIDADFRSPAFDLDDLAPDAALLAAAAKERRLGPRVVPETRIALDKLQRTDARVSFRIERLLWKKPTPFTSASGRLVLDHGLLTLSPLTVGLAHGTMTGRAVVTQRDEHAPTRLSLDLRARDARLEDFVPQPYVAAPLRGRVTIEGEGKTVREAVGRGAGRIAFVSIGGTLDRRAAELVGRNIGRALRAERGERVPLRCLIADLRGSDGRFSVQPLLVDSPIARADGRGTLSFPDEKLALTVTGGSKVPAAFRLTGPLRILGTIKVPDARPSPDTVSAGGLFKMIGRAIAGKKEAAARDADCGALGARALG